MLNNPFKIKKSAFVCVMLLTFAGFLNAQNSAKAHFFDGKKTRELKSVQQLQNAEQAPSHCGLQFFFGTNYYNLYLTSAQIDLLKSASQEYISDFENKKLSQKDKKALEKYGEISARLEWGTSRKNMAGASDNAGAAFGYAFIKQSPYFVLSIKNAKNKNDAAPSPLASSGQVYLFFTKAQIAELLQLLLSQNPA